MQCAVPPATLSLRSPANRSSKLHKLVAMYTQIGKVTDVADRSFDFVIVGKPCPFLRAHCF